MTTKSFVIALLVCATYLVSTPPLRAASSGAAPAFSDSEIAGIVEAANQVEIDAGKYVESKSLNIEVINFSKEMIRAHSDLDTSVDNLLREGKIPLIQSEVSRKIMREGKISLTHLKMLKGKMMDEAYAQDAVKAHQGVLDTIDEILLPNVVNPDLKALLVQARPVVVSHLAHAKMLVNSMSSPRS